MVNIEDKDDKRERVSVFIDGNNFYYGCKKTIETTNIDFKKFVEIIIGERELFKVYYYNALLDKNKDKKTFEKQQRFLEELRKIGVEVVLCNVRKKKVDGKVMYQIKGDDVNLAVDMVTNAVKGTYDTAILVSGDGDFLPAVRAVKDEFHKKVENAIFKVNQSHDLRILCQPHIIYMDGFIDKCKRKGFTIPFVNE